MASLDDASKKVRRELYERYWDFVAAYREVLERCQALIPGLISVCSRRYA
jgi:hypothetical protein